MDFKPIVIEQPDNNAKKLAQRYKRHKFGYFARELHKIDCW